MIKEVTENKPALLILLIFFVFYLKNRTLHLTKAIEIGGNIIMKYIFFLKYTLDTIIGTPRNSYE